MRYDYVGGTCRRRLHTVWKERERKWDSETKQRSAKTAASDLLSFFFWLQEVTLINTSRTNIVFVTHQHAARLPRSQHHPTPSPPGRNGITISLGLSGDTVIGRVRTGARQAEMCAARFPVCHVHTAGSSVLSRKVILCYLLIGKCQLKLFGPT